MIWLRKFKCWYCELWIGDEDETVEESELCGLCRKMGVV